MSASQIRRYFTSDTGQGALYAGAEAETRDEVGVGREQHFLTGVEKVGVSAGVSAEDDVKVDRDGRGSDVDEGDDIDAI
ncbi:hypothetical protein CVT25_007193 [Psilocybe cyanescens]|uniref:Uncharacterized protein n=1 Tax=Psilocybe cyanescens TaxID=93625 RepID=A0A409WVK8_PSICY|nr:hypothetical protein CVT25_007193 [Psilocybe cyanescens]